MCEYRYKGYEQVQGMSTGTGGMHKYRGVCTGRGVVHKHTWVCLCAEAERCAEPQRCVHRHTQVCTQVYTSAYTRACASTEGVLRHRQVSTRRCEHLHRVCSGTDRGEHTQV